MIYGRVVERVIISRENLEELTFEDVSLRGKPASVTFRNRASGSGLETGRYAKRSEDFARFFLSFEDF